MTAQSLEYKNRVKEDLIAYQDKKNLITNPKAQLEWSIIERFEKEQKIKLEDLTEDNEFFRYRTKELVRMQEPLLKKVVRFLKSKHV